MLLGVWYYRFALTDAKLNSFRVGYSDHGSLPFTGSRLSFIRSTLSDQQPIAFH